MASIVPLLVAAAGGVSVFLLMQRHGWSRPASAAWALALAPGAGLGLLSLAFFFWVFAGFPPPGRWPLLALFAVLAGAFSLPVYSRRLGSPGGPLWAPGRPLRVRLIMLSLVAVSLGHLLWSYSRISAAQPAGSWDAVAIWNSRANFLYRANGDLAAIFAQLKHGHPDYPLLLPAATAAQYGLWGGEDLAIPQTTGLVFTLATVAVLFLAVARHGSLVAAGAAAALLSATPNFGRWGFVQCADVPLAYLLLGAAVTLSSQLDGRGSRRLPPVLAGLFLSLLVWIKNEGLVLALLLVAAWSAVAVFASGFDRDLRRRMPWIVAAAVPGVLALVLFKVFWSPVFETAGFVDGALPRILTLERWQAVARGFWGELDPWSGAARWGLLWPFLGLCAVLYRRRRIAAGRPVLVLGGLLLLAWPAWFTIYLCTPADVEWHLRSSLGRLMLQLAPLTLAWALVGAGQDAASRGSPAKG